MALLSNDLDTAETCYQQAIATACAQSARLFELRATTRLAHHWRDRGRLTQARDLLAPIYAWFTEGFDTPDLKESRSLLNELGR